MDDMVLQVEPMVITMVSMMMSFLMMKRMLMVLWSGRGCQSLGLGRPGSKYSGGMKTQMMKRQ